MWMSSIAITLGYGVVQTLTLMSVISVETRDWCEIGFALYVTGVPFIAVVYLNFRKLYYLYNQSSSVRRTRIANTMSVMFFIIILIYLLSTIYPLFYAIDRVVFRNISFLDRSKRLVGEMFSFSLIVRNFLNPLIYFLFSPPVLRLLSRLRNIVTIIQIYKKSYIDILLSTKNKTKKYIKFIYFILIIQHKYLKCLHVI